MELRNQLAAASGKNSTQRAKKATGKNSTLPPAHIDILASTQTHSASSSGSGIILEEQAGFAAQRDAHHRGVENLNRRVKGDFNNNLTPNNKTISSPSDSSSSGSYSSPDNTQTAEGATELNALQRKRKRQRAKKAAADKLLAESNERIGGTNADSKDDQVQLQITRHNNEGILEQML